MYDEPDQSTPMLEGGRLLADRYRLLEKIGEGGAAEVFRARDQRLDRIVAIKLLRTQFLADPASRKRFVIEAKMSAALNHPNIVDIYDFGEAVDGSMFIAMKFIDGQNLKDILQKRGRMTPAEVVSVAQQVCRALSTAHQKGLIHRDVKPQNIMIESNGNVVLTDFGIVKALAAPALTQTGMTFGTAAYLSPEQATGAPVGAPADVYALGCVMYELLSGMPPFVGDNPAVVAYKQVWEQPSPLHERVPEVPPSLENVVMRCLGKDPNKRYPSAEALASELEALQTSFLQPTQAISVGLGAMAAYGANAGEYTPASSLAPAERSAPVPMPLVADPAITTPPPVRAQPTFNSVPMPYVQQQQARNSTRPMAEPRLATAPHARQVQTINVERRRIGWLPLGLLGIVGLGLCGLLAWQGPGFMAAVTGGRGVPTATLTVALAIEATSTVGVVAGVVTPATEPTAPVAPTNTPPPLAPTDTPPPVDTPAPTNTPQPPAPTEVVPPTQAPIVVATDTPPPLAPTNTPEPQPPGEGSSLTLEDSSFVGGRTGQYQGRSARWIYGQGTQVNTMATAFNLTGTPNAGRLVLLGNDDERPEKSRIRVTVNDLIVYEGENPLPNTTGGPGGRGIWGEATFDIPSGYLIPGTNTIAISNLDTSNCARCPNFVMLDSATVTLIP